MKDEQRRRYLTVQVEKGGVRRAVRGVLNRSAGRSDLGRWRKFRDQLWEEGRSLLPFVLGLLLASLYGATALFLQKQPLWLCVYATLALAGLAAFGMGLSPAVRADVAVLLPTLCSAHGRRFLLFLFVSLLLTGPLSNTLENTERAASSLLCSAELAANQTQELMQRAATPLSSVLDRIREISSNAHAMAGRVQNLILALTDGIRHVARTLRNVLHFLVHIGDVCNDKLGSPYRKCRAVFADAQADCSELLGEFNFLCHIMDGFLPLCSLARAGELFCIVPSYIGDQLKKRLAAPTLAAFERMKREFEFNISASVNFDLDTNSSVPLQQLSQDILDQVSSALQTFQRLGQPLAYAGLVLLAISFLRAGRYRRRYLRDLSFDNIYISAQFEKLDQKMKSGGGASVLPITRREAKTYITPLSLQLSAREWRAVYVAVVSVLKQLLVGVVLVALDFLVFWMMDQVHHQVKGDVVARAPVTVVLQVNGSGYASDIFRDLVASFNVLQRGNVTVISRKCLLQPSPPDYVNCFVLGFLLGLALLIALFGGLVQRCRQLVCASFHPERELERIWFLRQQILDQRRAEGRALRVSAGGGGGGGGGWGGSRFQTLLLRLPGGPYLSHLLGLSSVTCLFCGEALRPEDDNTAACDVPGCPGVYCRPCFLSLGNTCVVCARPLISLEDGEEERDSSDDEQLNSTHISDTPLMKTTVSMATPQRGTLKDGGDRHVRVDSDSELSEADMSYQDSAASDDSDDSFCSLGSRQHRTLQTVAIQGPDAPPGPPGS